MRRNLSHENFHDDQTIDVGGDRAFGCKLGAILLLLGMAKAFTAGMVTPVALLIATPGAVLLSLGIVAPFCLSPLNRLWLKLGIAIGKLVNPIVLALLFFLVITPMALLMRIIGKRPLHLAPDRSAASYWIARGSLEGDPSSMRRQF